MRRAGHLFEQVCDWHNLRLALCKASLGKRGRPDCQAYRDHATEELAALERDLRAGTVRVGDYRYFTVWDPKERRICAAAFRERVLHHALMNVCEPIFERALIDDTFACRKGKGRLAALDRAQHFARRHGWFLKLDVRRFFDSVNHDVLREHLLARFKDRQILAVFNRIIESHSVAPGCGLPIGNLTSQHFANSYLAPLDRFVKEKLRRRGYVRYMDDFAVWGDGAGDLKQVRAAITVFVAKELRLELKPNWQINRCARGMEFLGCRMFPSQRRLTRRGGRRFLRKWRRAENLNDSGAITEGQLAGRVLPLLAFVRTANTVGFRRGAMAGRKLRVAAKGARTASTAAAVGTTTPGTAAPPTATGTTRTTATTTWASGSPSPRSSDRWVDARQA